MIHEIHFVPVYIDNAIHREGIDCASDHLTTSTNQGQTHTVGYERTCFMCLVLQWYRDSSPSFLWMRILHINMELLQSKHPLGTSLWFALCSCSHQSKLSSSSPGGRHQTHFLINHLCSMAWEKLADLYFSLHKCHWSPSRYRQTDTRPTHLLPIAW